MCLPNRISELQGPECHTKQWVPGAAAAALAHARSHPVVELRDQDGARCHFPERRHVHDWIDVMIPGNTLLFLHRDGGTRGAVRTRSTRSRGRLHRCRSVKQRFHLHKARPQARRPSQSRRNRAIIGAGTTRDFIKNDGCITRSAQPDRPALTRRIRIVARRASGNIGRRLAETRPKFCAERAAS